MPNVIHQVPVDLVPDLWRAISPHAVRAMDYHPFMDHDDLLQLIMDGRATLFVVLSGPRVLGFACMEVVHYPRRKVALVLAAGGELGFLSVAVNELLPRLKEWGCKQGADTFAILGRPGWLRALRDQGGKSSSQIVWALRLDDDRHSRRREQQQTAATNIDHHVNFGPLGGSTALH